MIRSVKGNVHAEISSQRNENIKASIIMCNNNERLGPITVPHGRMDDIYFGIMR